jgi:hypothetical protein
MPQDRATAAELLAGVRAFLRDEVLPQLQGGSAYRCRVAANILAIVGRELEQGAAADRAELAGLERLLGKPAPLDLERDAALDALNAELCAAIRSGALDQRRAEVLAQVRATVRAKLAIANPDYPALRE